MPPLAAAADLAHANAQHLETAECRIAGRPLREFRAWSRQACLAAARRWMSETLHLAPPPADTGLLFVTGHQPQLSHPGVWAKNMAVAELARRGGGIGLNLIVDNDLTGPQSIRVPAGPREEPRFAEIPFDEPQPLSPWEEIHVRDKTQFREFAGRVEEALRDWNIHPLLTAAWPGAIETLSRSEETAVCLTACRVSQERRFGIFNLELPVSELCRTEPFLAFVSHCCRHREQLFGAYNRAVAAYRQQYGIRNARHPVPDLERRGDLLELPFWFWRPGDRDRRRVFVGSTGAEIDLYADSQPLARLGSPQTDVAVLAELQQTGRLRTRALTTTLFARLCLGDLFIHGIGGAKYDEVTDALITSLFEIPAPAFLTVTATLHLPLRPFPVGEDQVRDLKRRLRDLQFNADQVLDGPDLPALRERKAALLAEIAGARSRGLSKRERLARRPELRRRHLELRQVQEALSAPARDALRETRQALETVSGQLRANAILQSREYPGLLFPEEMIRALLERIHGLCR